MVVDEGIHGGCDSRTGLADRIARNSPLDAMFLPLPEQS